MSALELSLACRVRAGGQIPPIWEARRAAGLCMRDIRGAAVQS